MSDEEKNVVFNEFLNFIENEEYELNLERIKFLKPRVDF